VGLDGFLDAGDDPGQSLTMSRRVVLAHDSVTVPGGAERTLETLLVALPRNALYTAIHRPQMPLRGLGSRAIHSSFLQHARLRAHRLKLLFPLAFATFRLPRDVDLVLSSSSGYAKGIKAPGGVPHLSYIHTPIRRIWNPFHRAARRTPGGPPGRWLEKVSLAWLRHWDLVSMARVGHLVTNAKNTALQIQRIYGRGAMVVPPPVRTSFFTPPADSAAGQYYLAVSRLDPYKRLDLAIAACDRLRARLVIVGDGVERRRLESLAGPRVRFAGVADDVTLRSLYQGCRALIFPGEEDFGIVPVEAQACGKPVIAFGAGGALETVVDGLTGVFFHEPTPSALIAAIETSERASFDPGWIRHHALPFDEQRFAERMLRLVDGLTGRPGP
jgi:glycosyltransferase involved in cell wall biosynthesis